MRRLFTMLLASALLLMPTASSAAQAKEWVKPCPAHLHASQCLEFYFTDPDGHDSRFVVTPMDSTETVRDGLLFIRIRIDELEGKIHMANGAQAVKYGQCWVFSLRVNKNRQVDVTGECMGHLSYTETASPLAVALTATGSGRCLDQACQQIAVQIEASGPMADAVGVCGKMSQKMELLFDRQSKTVRFPGSGAPGTGTVSVRHTHWVLLDSDSQEMTLSGCGQIMLDDEEVEASALKGRHTAWVSLDGIRFGFNYEEIRWDYSSTVDFRFSGVTKDGQPIVGIGRMPLELGKNGKLKTGRVEFQGTIGQGTKAIEVSGSGKLDLDTFTIGESVKNGVRFSGTGTMGFMVEISGVNAGY